MTSATAPTRARIVSLLPSATEIVCGLGLRANLVGVSHECDHPADVVGLPVVTRPKIDVRRSSREIDDDIRALVRDGLGVYEIDVEEHRSETWHYKDMLHEEHALLEGLRGKVEALAEAPKLAASAK